MATTKSTTRCYVHWLKWSIELDTTTARVEHLSLDELRELVGQLTKCVAGGKSLLGGYPA
jgi:hypothetical protein